MVKAWLKYTLIRLGVFAVALAALILVGVPGVPATLLAAVLALCIAYIFFGKLRAAMVTELAERRANAVAGKDVDAEAEDAEVRDR